MLHTEVIENDVRHKVGDRVSCEVMTREGDLVQFNGVVISISDDGEFYEVLKKNFRSLTLWVSHKHTFIFGLEIDDNGDGYK